MTLSTDVVIVGAGPTGLMAAVLLYQSGISFRIFDKTEQQAHESRAFALHARSLELLQKIGLVDEFLKRGMIAPGVQLFGRHGKIAEMNIDDIGELNSPYTFLFMCPQNIIEQIFVDYLKKHHITIEHSTEVTDVQQKNDLITVTTQTPHSGTETLQCRYVIGADGAHSIVRRLLQLDFVGGEYTESFLLADCAIEWPWDYEHIKLFLKNKSIAAYLPIKGKSLGRMIVIQPYALEHDSALAKQATLAEPVTLEEVQQALNEATYTPIVLSNPVWTSRYRIHHRAVLHYSVGNIFVAGDAAHIHSPAGGQGMNTGLQDAANLVWKIVLHLKNKNGMALLNTYNAERWPVGQKLLHFTDRLFSMMSSQNPIRAWIRTHIFPCFFRFMSKHRRTRYWAFHFLSQLGIHYGPNAFLADHWPVKNAKADELSAGHRAPNGQITRHQDVFSLISGYYFHILVLSKASLSTDTINEISKTLEGLPSHIGLPIKTHFVSHSLIGPHKHMIQAESNEVFENYAITVDKPYGVFVIRPDGYIAYRSNTLNGSELRAFLERFMR